MESWWVVMNTWKKSIFINWRLFDRNYESLACETTRLRLLRTLKIVKIPKFIINTIGKTPERVGPKTEVSRQREERRGSNRLPNPRKFCFFWSTFDTDFKKIFKNIVETPPNFSTSGHPCHKSWKNTVFIRIDNTSQLHKI